MEWSVYFQNPEFMEKTRFHLILPEMEPLVRKWCGIQAGSRVLDVGCGTGYFTRLLARGEPETHVTGVDLEQPFIDYARKRNEEERLSVDYTQADALALPFEAASFDIVASHTFLTVVDSPVKALREMLRVLRPGGMLASVTPMSFYPEATHPGVYPETCAWAKEFEALRERLILAYENIDPAMGRARGAVPAAMPHFLAAAGLERVSAYPLGKLFSLSNATLSDEEKLAWIGYYEASEEKKLDRFMALPEMTGYFSPEQAERYVALLREKCGWLREHRQENKVWEWSGGANLLVTGRKRDLTWINWL